MKKSFVSHTLVLGLLLLLLCGCGDGSCYDNGSAVPMARFYQSGTNTQVNVENLTVSAIGAPGDTLLVDDDTVTELFLPLHVSTQQTQWRMTFMTTDSIFVTDTLTMTYRPIEYFANVECGAMYYFDLTTVTTTQHMIDSITVPEPHVTHVDQLNLHIYVPIE